MSEYVRTIVPKRKFVFTSVEQSIAHEVVLADRIDVLPWRDLQLRIQVYSHTLAGTANHLQFRVNPQNWTPEDPGKMLVVATAASLLVTGSDPVPSFRTVSVPTTGANAMSHLAQVTILALKLTVAPFEAEISVELAGKD